jgi:hypothetical protein
MLNDFKPAHLQHANVKLDKLLSTSIQYKKNDDTSNQISLWKKFLGLFKTNPFVLPEELYKHK